MIPECMYEKDSWALLSDKQRSFCLNYTQCFNATKAYMMAYPDVKKENVAAAAASRLLRNVKVKRAMGDYLATLWSERTEIAGRALAEVIALAASDISHLVELRDGEVILKNLSEVDTRAVQEVYAEKDASGKSMVRVKMHSKSQALAQLIRLLGMLNTPEPEPVKIVVLPAIRPDRKRVTDSETPECPKLVSGED